MPVCKLADVLHQRVLESGLKIRHDGHPPPLPGQFDYLELPERSEHDCLRGGKVYLPPVLVVDVAVPEFGSFEGSPAWLWTAERSFEPYWLIGTSITHDGEPPSLSSHRPLTPVEASCALAQHPSFEGLNCCASAITLKWGNPCIRVFLRHGQIALRRWFAVGEPNHHAAYCEYTIHTWGPSVRHSVAGESVLS